MFRVVEFKIKYHKLYHYNIYEKNKIIKYLNYIKFKNFICKKTKKLYFIQDEKYLNFELFIYNIYAELLKENLIDFYMTTLMDKKNILNNFNPYAIINLLKTHEIVKKDFLYIYIIKVSCKKNIQEHMNYALADYLPQINYYQILNMINVVKKKDKTIFKKLSCVKQLFTLAIYKYIKYFINLNFNNCNKFSLYSNYIFIYGHNKDNLKETGKDFLNFLEDIGVFINKNKTCFIDKNINNLIYKNQILTPINFKSKNIFDEHALSLLNHYKNRNNDNYNPLISYNIRRVNNRLEFIPHDKNIYNIVTDYYDIKQVKKTYQTFIIENNDIIVSLYKTYFGLIILMLFLGFIHWIIKKLLI